MKTYYVGMDVHRASTAPGSDVERFLNLPLHL
jgi:hypothetical protein